MAQRLEFSEFTFGFALTENFKRRERIRGVPIFPSLAEEGARDGGYDVSLDMGSGLPLLLQFKVPQVINRRSKWLPPGFTTPYYRVHLRCRINDEGYSQHSVLLQHERNGYAVYYAAPRFHESAGLDYLFTSGQVVERSAFFTPVDVGELSDAPHHVAYCDSCDDGWLRSEPVKMPHPMTADAFLQRLGQRVRESIVAEFSFQDLLESMVVSAERALFPAPFAAIPGKESSGRPKRKDDELRRMHPGEFAARISESRRPREAAALFARLWLSAELLIVQVEQ